MCRVTPITRVDAAGGRQGRRLELQDVREHRLRAALAVAAGDANDEGLDAAQARHGASP